MKEKEFHCMIEKQNEDGKNVLRREIVHEAANAKAHKRKTRWIVSLASACACIICLAIVLPIAFKSESNEMPANRYCSIQDYVLAPVGNTVKEYSEQNGKKFLYVDWYDVAEDVQTMWFVHKDNSSDRICLEESYANRETGDIIVLQIVPTNVAIDSFEAKRRNYENEHFYNDIAIKWYKDVFQEDAIFDYGGYSYFLGMQAPSGEIDILDIAESMLQNI